MNKDNKKFPQFFPPNYELKQKVGSGGLSPVLIRKAQRVIDENDIEFSMLASPYMTVLNEGIAQALGGPKSRSQEEITEAILFPAMQLKANGELFHYPIITTVGARLLFFIERVNVLNTQAIEIVIAFERAIKIIFDKKLKGEVSETGQKIIEELDAVCNRFFEKYPENIHPRYK